MHVEATVGILHRKSPCLGRKLGGTLACESERATKGPVQLVVSMAGILAATLRELDDDDCESNYSEDTQQGNETSTSYRSSR